jgi:hypothetical protein
MNPSQRPSRPSPAVLLLALAPWLTAGCSGAAAAPAAPSPSPSGHLVATTPRFAFYSDPWVNLHHVLYFRAALEEARATGEHRRFGLGPGDTDRMDELPEGELAPWRRAVDLYRRELGRRDLLFDDAMVAARNALARGGAEELERELPSLALPRELAEVLAAAEPVYRAHLWPDHDRGNRDWVEAVLPLLERHGDAMARGIARAWDAPWPAEPTRVDVSVYAFWPGAYTSNLPNHIVISSLDRDHAGRGALESLFHEASHFRDFEQGLLALVDRGFERAGRPAPERLWHLVLFYTAGAVTRHVLAAAGEPPYEPYALGAGVVSRNPNGAAVWNALEAHWRPFLEGSGEREEAFAAVVRALTAGEAGPAE